MWHCSSTLRDRSWCIIRFSQYDINKCYIKKRVKKFLDTGTYPVCAIETLETIMWKNAQVSLLIGKDPGGWESLKEKEERSRGWDG